MPNKKASIGNSSPRKRPDGTWEARFTINGHRRSSSEKAGGPFCRRSRAVYRPQQADRLSMAPAMGRNLRTANLESHHGQYTPPEHRKPSNPCFRKLSSAETDSGAYSGIYHPTTKGWRKTSYHY